MTSAIKLLGQVQLGTALTTVYEVPSSPQNVHARVNAIWIANTDSVPHAVTLRVGTGTLTVANALSEAWAVPANTTFVVSGSEWILSMSAGMKLQGLADVAAKVTVTASGDESE
jgi:hypothetical protein